MMKNKILSILMIMVTMTVTSGCANAVRVDGPYEGRILDAETGQPIEGVVVLGVWNTEMATPAGATHKFYDAKETVTDKNGDFSMQGMGFEILSNVTPMDVLIFKAGYEYESGSWNSLKKYAKNIKWEGNKAIIPLKRLTMEERVKQGSPDYPSEAQEEKKKLMLREINKDRAERGLKPVN